MKENDFEDIEFIGPRCMAGDPMEEGEGDSDLAFEDEVEHPKLYKVLLHNDDYTTMEFVIFILRRVFYKSAEEAEQLMWKIHKEGFALCGVYTHEIAETKVEKVAQLSRSQEHPLKCTMEEE